VGNGDYPSVNFRDAKNSRPEDVPVDDLDGRPRRQRHLQIVAAVKLVDGFEKQIERGRNLFLARGAINDVRHKFESLRLSRASLERARRA